MSARTLLATALWLIVRLMGWLAYKVLIPGKRRVADTAFRLDPSRRTL